jgi:hypothetical protein
MEDLKAQLIEEFGEGNIVDNHRHLHKNPLKSPNEARAFDRKLF